MKNLVFIFVCCIALASYAQEKPKTTLVDEFNEICNEDMQARLDNFLVQLGNDPLARGVVIFHGRSDTTGRNRKLVNYIVEYPKRRGFTRETIGAFSGRIKMVLGENRHEQLIQFWLVPAGADAPKPNRPLTESYEHTTLFDRAPADFHRWERVLDIYSDGFYDLGCNFSPNRGLFAKILKENKNLNGFLIVYTVAKTPSRGVRIASFALNDLVKNFTVSRRRVRAIYGGVREKPEVEFWLVPRGAKRPPVRPNWPSIRTF